MSMLSALAKRWHYSVESPGSGRLLYREGNREYTFPIYRENGVLILVAVPSFQRVHFFFTWHAQDQEFPDSARDRILPRIADHFRGRGLQVRVFERGAAGGEFEFYPELFEKRNRVNELLDDAGYNGFADYSAIDLLHGEYGLEVCGIQNERDANVIAGLLRRAFPHWHHLNICRQDCSRDQGWAVALSMFPAPSSHAGWREED